MAGLSVYRKHNLLYTQERIECYGPGGYHPVCLGDSFNNDRYKVYHKLGWGGFSTVWLANDTRRVRVPRDSVVGRSKWIALKIMKANHSSASRELHNLQLLTARSKEDAIPQRIALVLDSFVHEGPNGAHQCLVFDLLGPSLGDVISCYEYEGETLEPDVILRICGQLLEALRVLHAADMVHGDINVRNIAFQCTDLSNASTEKILQVLGEPKYEELARLDGKPLDPGLPKQIVEAARWRKWFDEDEEDICIIDLGEAFVQGEEPKKLAQPRDLRVPETFFTGRFDHKVDSWAAGCVVNCLVFGAYPFGCPGDDAILVGEMIGFVDELPEKWQQKWDEMRQASQFRVGLNELEGVQKGELEKRFKEHVDDAKLAILLLVIQGLMRLDPSERLSASEALDLLRSKKVASCNMQA